jgi:FKBP-type peptidyl-prolyl cis-trans isomerase SlyD
VVTVVEVKDEAVVIDGNHALAGMDLNFEVKVVDVREASAEEIEHGHVHGPGGHNH